MGDEGKRFIWVTDPPDPNCPYCNGRGMVGGCGVEGCNHAHTFSFCPCVNERMTEVTDNEWEERNV